VTSYAANCFRNGKDKKARRRRKNKEKNRRRKRSKKREEGETVISQSVTTCTLSTNQRAAGSSDFTSSRTQRLLFALIEQEDMSVEVFEQKS
jgi:hypothetical protein